MIEAQHGRKVGALEKDNGGEFTSMEILKYLAWHESKYSRATEQRE